VPVLALWNMCTCQGSMPTSLANTVPIVTPLPQCTSGIAATNPTGMAVSATLTSCCSAASSISSIGAYRYTCDGGNLSHSSLSDSIYSNKTTDAHALWSCTSQRQPASKALAIRIGGRRMRIAGRPPTGTFFVSMMCGSCRCAIAASSVGVANTETAPRASSACLAAS